MVNYQEGRVKLTNIQLNLLSTGQEKYLLLILF